MSNTTRFINALLFVGEGMDYPGGELTVNGNYDDGKWTIDNGSSWHDIGDTVSLSVGTYNLQFMDIPSSYYGPPQPQDISIISGEDKTITATYQNTKGKLTVTGIVHTRNQTENGGSFTIDGGDVIECGTSTYLLGGTRTLVFTDIQGRITPDTQTVAIVPGQDTDIEVHYYQQGYAIYNGAGTPVETGMTKDEAYIGGGTFSSLEIYKNGNINDIHQIENSLGSVEVFSGGTVSGQIYAPLNNATIHSGAYIEYININKDETKNGRQILYNTGELYIWDFSSTGITNATIEGGTFGTIEDSKPTLSLYSNIVAGKIKGNVQSEWAFSSTPWPDMYNVTKEVYYLFHEQSTLELSNSSINEIENYGDLILTNNSIVNIIFPESFSEVEYIFMYDGNVASSDDRQKRFLESETQTSKKVSVSATRGCIVRNFNNAVINGTYYVLDGTTSSNIEANLSGSIGTAVVENGGTLNNCHCNVIVQSGGIANNISAPYKAITLEVMSGGVARQVYRSSLLTVIAHEGSIVEYAH